jgi:hypothetical protein
MTNPNPSPELLACPNPWCHSHDRDFPLHHLGIVEWPIVHGRIGFRVWCSDCGICGPIVDSKSAVYAAWNTRAALSQTPTPSLSIDVQSAATGCHEHDVSLKVAMPAPGEVEAGTGWVAWNPDSGEEYTPNHPVESGECVEAERIRRSTPQEDVLWNAFQGEFQRAHDLETRLAATPTLATVAAGDDEGVARIIDPKAWQDRDEYMALRGRAASWDSTADSLAKAAAIRLLSQGEGK